jgi:hypothetical protein
MVVGIGDGQFFAAALSLAYVEAKRSPMLLFSEGLSRYSLRRTKNDTHLHNVLSNGLGTLEDFPRRL